MDESKTPQKTENNQSKEEVSQTQFNKIKNIYIKFSLKEFYQY